MMLPTPDANAPSLRHPRVDTHSTTSIRSLPFPPLSAAETSLSMPIQKDGDYSALQLAPPTVRRVVTTTTTTTLSFPPLLIPRPQPVATSRDGKTLDKKKYPLAEAETPWNLRRFRLDQIGDMGTSQGGLARGLIYDRVVPLQTASSSTSSINVTTNCLQKPREALLPTPDVSCLEGYSSYSHSKLPSGSGSWRNRRRKRQSTTPAPCDGPPPRKKQRQGSLTLQPTDSNPHGSGGELILPSPKMSPPSPVETTYEGDEEEEDTTDKRHSQADSGFFEEGLEQYLEQSQGSGFQLKPDGSLEVRQEHASGIHTMLSLPSLVSTFSTLAPQMQTYVLFSLLKQSPVSVLQNLHTIIIPALRRDFLTDLPPELAVLVLTHLDATSLCRAAQVCKGWAKMIDGEWRVWRDRLRADGLWDGQGDVELEIKDEELGLGGGKERKKKREDQKFLKMWFAGIWDDVPGEENEFGDREIIQRARATNCLLPRVSIERKCQLVKRIEDASKRNIRPSILHYVHPYKLVYRRRFVSRRNWMEREPQRMAFPGHANNVITCLQFDEHRIVSASDDHNINVYDTKTGQLSKTLEGHDGGVWALEYIGNTLVSGSTDRTVRVWNLATTKNTHVFLGHTSTVRCLQIVRPVNVQTNPAGPPIWEPPYPIIVTGSRDYTLRMWRLPGINDDWYLPEVPPSPNSENVHFEENPFHIRLLKGHHHAVRALAARGRVLVSGSYDYDCRVWDIMSGECVRVLKGHTQKVYSIVLTEDGTRCMSGSMDGTVRIWDIESGQVANVLEGHSSLVGLLGLSKHLLVSAAADSTLRLWHPVTGEHLQTLAAHSGAITCFNHDENKVVSGSDGTLKLWDIKGEKPPKDLITGLSGVWQVGFDDRLCVTAVQRNGQSEFEILDFGKDIEELYENETFDEEPDPFEFVGPDDETRSKIWSEGDRLNLAEDQKMRSDKRRNMDMFELDWMSEEGGHGSQTLLRRMEMLQDQMNHQDWVDMDLAGVKLEEDDFVGYTVKEEEDMDLPDPDGEGEGGFARVKEEQEDGGYYEEDEDM